MHFPCLSIDLNLHALGSKRKWNMLTLPGSSRHNMAIFNVERVLGDLRNGYALPVGRSDDASRDLQGFGQHAQHASGDAEQLSSDLLSSLLHRATAYIESRGTACSRLNGERRSIGGMHKNIIDGNPQYFSSHLR